MLDGSKGAHPLFGPLAETTGEDPDRTTRHIVEVLYGMPTFMLDDLERALEIYESSGRISCELDDFIRRVRCLLEVDEIEARYRERLRLGLPF